ncbi:uncharacterized protein MYCFIDRAFT_193597 [Pseudocercospora fijiensis CIRAD86]|uniref:Protein ZIP4 homolog n=1 Tax=Pseudocercospora fijiensis (strain CIRAD86) TaxID=383855 RepID=N1QC03_PSEFD|nr:uncharacterized protein MYCFIDRAFT_193597 [Pseudocercospora fijiensis CIRAD86]EME89756.1 hypothetical protein MYCFIDRAFT_193597 [Pseudocercospora fijiensis CIRAD86]
MAPLKSTKNEQRLQAAIDPRVQHAHAAQVNVTVRVFSMLLLDASHHASKRRSRDRAPETPDLLEISNVENNDVSQHEPGQKVLEREYFLLRVLHAWKSQRLDLADHFFQCMSKVKIPDCPESRLLCIKVADLCYEMAKAQCRAKDISTALKWSERGFAVLERCEDEDFGQEAVELRLSIAVALVLPILRLRVLTKQNHVDAGEVSEVLQRLVRLAMLTEDNFTIVMQTLRKAEQISTEPALHALRLFICDRLLPEVKSAQARDPQVMEWLEKTIITYILFVTGGNDFASGKQASDVKDLLDKVEQASGASLSTKATHAAQTLIWKATGGSDEDTPIACCRLLQHPIFERAGHINKARIGRRLMRISLKQNDLPAVREALYNMPSTSQADPATAYLAFKTALQSDDQELATNSLKTIVKNTTEDPAYLYAAVLDAQQSKMKLMALASLKALIDQKPPGIQMATLLRCTARLLMAEADLPNQDINAIAEEVVAIFEMAAKSINEIRKLPEDQLRSEMLWWSKNAYNLTLRFCPSVHPDFTSRMMSVCLTFLDHIPKHAGLMHEIELTKRKLLCLFLSTTAKIILARSNSENNNNNEESLQYYLQALTNIQTFKSCATTLSPEDQDPTTNAHTFSILKYELESILHLHRWHDLPSSLQSCIDFTPVTTRWDTLADIIIILHPQLTSSSSSSELLLTLLQKIINETWKSDERKSMSKVARWLRFTLTFSLEEKNNNDDFALKLLGQAAIMAEKGARGKQEVYPDAELRWLASRGFNHGIDLISGNPGGGGGGGGGEEAEKWMGAALEVARWVDDEGQLHKALYDSREEVRERVKRMGRDLL